MNEIELKAASEGLEVAKGFLQKLINPPIEELGLFFADNLRFWRYKNQLKILTKAQKYIDEHNICIKPIPIKVLVPLLDSASLEEDNDLKDKWSALLINYADCKNNFDTYFFPKILSELSSKDAKCLEWASKKNRRDIKEFTPVRLNLEVSNCNLYNLKRLGLIEILRNLSTDKVLKEYMIAEDFQPVYDSGISEIEITDLGKMFIEACTLTDKD